MCILIPYPLPPCPECHLPYTLLFLLVQESVNVIDYHKHSYPVQKQRKIHCFSKNIQKHLVDW